jgi:nucleotide-binding universal stress UspA family protein
MKKIIAAIDAMHFSENQLDGFHYVAKEAKGEITVVFLEDIIGQGIAVARAYPDGAYNYEQIAWSSREERDRIRTENLEKFYTACSNAGLEIHVHEAAGSPIEEIVKESRFADLLLINNNTSFASLNESNPPKFVKDVLADAQCPVMVLPEEVLPAREIVFSYNGTFSSMYAIRQFSQLFPDLSDMPVTVIYVAEGNAAGMPYEKQLRDYLDHHYDQVSYKLLSGDPAAEFLAMLLPRKDCIVTYGAYGRSRLSRFFHRSDAENVLRTVNTPVFITHP